AWGAPTEKMLGQPMSSVEIIPSLLGHTGASGAPTEKTLGPADVIKHWGNPLKNILGPADVIGRNYSKSAGPIQEHRGHPLKDAGPADGVGRNYSKSAGPMQEHWGTHRKTLGPADVISRHYPKSAGPIQGIGTPTETILGPADGIGINYSKSAGPIHGHWGTHRKNYGPSCCHWYKLFQICWAHARALGAPTETMLGQPMSSVKIVPSLLGPYKTLGAPTKNILASRWHCIGGTHQKNSGPSQFIGKHYPKSARPIQGHSPTEKCLGPPNAISRHYPKSAGPIQEYRGHPPKKFWAQLMALYKGIRGTHPKPAGPIEYSM
ncbi:hypothetical protein BJV77DRAFT_962422, partial [Russula vinacea]